MYDPNKITAKNTFKLVVGATLALFLLTAFFGAFATVGPGHRGVVIKLGAVQDRVLDEGFHFILPFVETVKQVDVTVQKYTSVSSAASKDLQTVTNEIALNYHLDPLRVNELYQTFRGEERMVVVEPAIEESVKAATAQFTAEELITTRAIVKETIETELKERMTPYGIIVDSVNIINFDFSVAFNEAIEAKVTAEQTALAEKNKLEQIRYEAEQRIVQAEAEAEAIRIQAAAITQQGGDDYVKLQWINAWNGVLPTTMLGESSDVILGL